MGTDIFQGFRDLFIGVLVPKNGEHHQCRVKLPIEPDGCDIRME
jgi:hypothetical protein